VADGKDAPPLPVSLRDRPDRLDADENVRLLGIAEDEDEVRIINFAQGPHRQLFSTFGGFISLMQVS